MTSRRRVSGSLAIALLGGIGPALIGLLATIGANARLAPSTMASLLMVWTVSGFLSLTDFGLMRTAAAFTATTGDARGSLLSLRRVSLLIGTGLTVPLAAFLFIIQERSPQLGLSALWLMTGLPILSCYTFPVVGSLEGSGRFGVVATHKALNAATTYLAPAVLGFWGGGGLVAGMGVLLAYRVLAVILLPRFLAPRIGSVRSGTHTRPDIVGVLTWIGLSSLLGPAFLYLDRLVIAGQEVSIALFIAYTSLSEVFIKSYIIPTSLMSVVYPWTVRGLSDRPTEVRRIFVTRLPVLTAFIAVACALVVFALPSSTWSVLSVPEVYRDTVGSVAATLAFGTLVNWSSQGLIGYLQAVGAQRGVALAQVAIMPAYILTLWVAVGHGVVYVAAVWSARVGLMWIGLWLMTARAPLRWEKE